MRFLIIISLLVSCCKSDTRGAWDKEIDLRDHGFLLQLKYDEPLNPLKGGKVHLNLQNKHLRNHLELRDLDVDFGFSKVGNGLFKGLKEASGSFWLVCHPWQCLSSNLRQE